MRPSPLLLSLALCACRQPSILAEPAPTASEPSAGAMARPPSEAPAAPEASAPRRRTGAHVHLRDGGCVYIPPEKLEQQDAEREARDRRHAPLLAEGCEAGERANCSMLAWHHERYGPAELAARYRERALALDRAACEEGDGGACLAVASVVRDTSDAEALELERRAARLSSQGCERGQAEPCERWAYQLKVGTGTDKDPARSQATFRRALGLHRAGCDAGRRAGCQGAFSLLIVGVDVPADEPLAARYRERALALYRADCARGDAAACRELRLWDEPLTSPGQAPARR